MVSCERCDVDEGSRFYGLFVGVDKYASNSFQNLRHAQRDATVLRALFQDNFPGEIHEVLGDEVIKDKFLTRIRHIVATSVEGDTVVILFSGHGTRAGDLAMVDANPDRLPDTAVSITEFVAEITRIKASVVFIVLDCCFSGGILAKVAQGIDDDYIAKSGEGVAAALDQISGQGRFILCAAGEDEQAFETNEFRHGVLTHYLIEGLLGHRKAVSGSKVSLLRLVDFVTEQAGSKGLGVIPKYQHPVLDGSAGHVLWPVLERGEHFAAADGGWRPLPVNAGVSSLAHRGASQQFISAWKERVGKLNSVQIRVVNEAGLLDGFDVLVSSPTGTGKTLVGEMAAARTAASGGRTVFLLPSRALVNEQYDRFSASYGALGLKVVRVTGEFRDQSRDFALGRYSMALLTYEKFTAMVFAKPDLLDAIGTIVVDEIQNMMLPDRGPRLEVLLTWLKARRARRAAPQVVALSAVLGDPDDLAAWLDAQPITSTKRAAPLTEGVLTPDGRYDHKGPDDERHVAEMLPPMSSTDDPDDLAAVAVRHAISAGRQVIVFRATRNEAYSFARRLSTGLGLRSAIDVLDRLPPDDAGHLAERLRSSLAGGVAFHIADLADDERRAIEEAFRSADSRIRVVVATTTLAQGVNLPADTVVICSLEHPRRQGRYTVSEYKNIAGRAGRPNLGIGDGRVLVLAANATDAEHKMRDYVLAEADATRSVLAEKSTDIRDLVLLALAGPVEESDGGGTAEVHAFLERTFAAHQHRVAMKDEPFPLAEIARVVADLATTGFVTEKRHRLKLTRLGELVVSSGLAVDSVHAVAEALRPVPVEGLNRMTLICTALLTPELADRRFVRSTSQWFREHQEFRKLLLAQRADPSVVARLMGEPARNGGGAALARQALACLMWSHGRKLANIERRVTRFLYTPNGRADGGPIRQAAQRVAHMIESIIQIAVHLHPDANLVDLAETLPVQLEIGIVKELVPVARYAGGKLDRWVYLRLHDADISSAGEVHTAEEAVLLRCVGGNRDRLRTLADAAVAALESAGRLDAADDFLDPPID
jgi:ATP-dependent DNA helicase